MVETTTGGCDVAHAGKPHNACRTITNGYVDTIGMGASLTNAIHSSCSQAQDPPSTSEHHADAALASDTQRGGDPTISNASALSVGVLAAHHGAVVASTADTDARMDLLSMSDTHTSSNVIQCNATTPAATLFAPSGIRGVTYTGPDRSFHSSHLHDPPPITELGFDDSYVCDPRFDLDMRRRGGETDAIILHVFNMMADLILSLAVRVAGCLVCCMVIAESLIRVHELRLAWLRRWNCMGPTTRATLRPRR